MRDEDILLGKWDPKICMYMYVLLATDVTAL